MTSPLKTGIYLISNVGQDLFLSRTNELDKSLNPRPIFGFPPGVQAQKWTIEAKPSGAYVLLIGGAPATEIDHKLFALQTAAGQLPEWFLKPGSIPDTFIIASHKGETWSINKANTQVDVGLVGVPEKDLLWKFTPVPIEEASPPLKTGRYLISNEAQGLYIGRGIELDLSLNPRPVLSLPGGVRAPEWIVEAHPTGDYTLFIGGAPTKAINNKLFALQIGFEEATKWTIRPGFHPGTYIVSTKENEAWSLPIKKPYTQVDVGFLGVPEIDLLWRFTQIPLDVKPPLKTGIYIINNVGQDLYIGRNIIEDKSGNPKEVISLPAGVLAPKWIVELLPDGSYTLRIGGAPTGVLDHKVFAFLVDIEQALKWKIEPGHLPDTFRISTQDGEAWSIGSKTPFSPIDVGFLGVPTPDALWRFTEFPFADETPLKT